MKAKVSEVLSDNIIRLDSRWRFHDLRGGKVKIAGLLPCQLKDRKTCQLALQKKLENQVVQLIEYLHVSGDLLHARVNLRDRPVQDLFPERRIPDLEPSRWSEPEEHRPIERILGGIPETWSNPLATLDPDRAPFWGSLRYPVRIWDKDFEREKKLADRLYSDSHQNRSELNRWFQVFLSSPQREAPLIVRGHVGVGKSWWIARQLSRLPKDKYDVALIDLRFKRRDDRLESEIDLTLDDYLNHYHTDLSWIYPEFKSVYGQDFNPDEPSQRQLIRERALSLTLEERNRLRLRSYARPRAKDFIIAFDNIDHFNEDEVSTILDRCRRVIGESAGVRVIVTCRPLTRLPKSRRGVAVGDVITRPVLLRSPDLDDVVLKRMSVNSRGEGLNLDTELPRSKWTLKGIFRAYKNSNKRFGTAELLRTMCCTEHAPAEDKEGGSRRPEQSTYDLRHFIKLFRRIVRSDVLTGFQHLGSLYYALHALLLRPGESMMEGEAYLFNLFDNERPDQRGNALARYRVLEYCKLFHDLGDLFDIYFRALGIGANTARQILDMFEDAGLIDVGFVETIEGKKVPVHGELSVPGRRHFELVTNLWYLICIKTGMNIYKNYILYGDKARRAASDFVTNDATLDVYASHGWVSETKLIEFIGNENVLEGRRIGEFQAQHEEFRRQIASMVSLRSNPAANLHYDVQEQLAYWKNARARN